jgi:hypothetical protein
MSYAGVGVARNTRRRRVTGRGNDTYLAGYEPGCDMSMSVSLTSEG